MIEINRAANGDDDDNEDDDRQFLSITGKQIQSLTLHRLVARKSKPSF